MTRDGPKNAPIRENNMDDDKVTSHGIGGGGTIWACLDPIDKNKAI